MPLWLETTAVATPAARRRSSASFAPGIGSTLAGSPLYGTSITSVPSRSRRTASGRGRVVAAPSTVISSEKRLPIEAARSKPGAGNGARGRSRTAKRPRRVGEGAEREYHESDRGLPSATDGTRKD